MPIELLILATLATGATIFVGFASAGLILNKSRESQKKLIEQEFFQYYSKLAAELLLQPLPILPSDSPANKRFKIYEKMTARVKLHHEKLSRWEKEFHRRILREVLIAFARDLSGETFERLIYFFYSFDFVDDEIKSLGDKNWWIRAQAVRDLGLIKAKRSVAPLTHCLEDAHPDVREQAMQSLLSIVGVEALSVIFRVARNLSMWTSIQLSLVVLRYKDEAVLFLLEGLESKDESIVIFCIEMLGKIGFVSAVNSLLKIAETYPNIRIRSKAIEALGRLGDSRSEALLTKCVDDPIPSIRLHAIEALGRIGSPTTVTVLKKRFHTGSFEERLAAARSMARCGEVGETFLESVSEGDVDIERKVALQILEETELG